MRKALTIVIFLTLVSGLQAEAQQRNNSWSSVYYGEYASSAKALAPYGKNDFIIVGSKGECGGPLVLATNGASVREFPFDLPVNEIQYIRRSRDSKTYIVSGDNSAGDFTGTWGGFIARIDSTGKVLWFNTYTNDSLMADSVIKSKLDFSTSFPKVVEAEDQSLYTYMEGGILFKYSSSGARLWKIAVEADTIKGIEVLQNKVYVSTPGRLLIYSDAGILLAAREGAYYSITSVNSSALHAIHDGALYTFYKDGNIDSTKKLLWSKNSSVIGIAAMDSSRMVIMFYSNHYHYITIYDTILKRTVFGTHLRYDPRVISFAATEEAVFIIGDELSPDPLNTSGDPVRRAYMRTVHTQGALGGDDIHGLKVTGIEVMKYELGGKDTDPKRSLYADMKLRIKNTGYAQVDSFMIYHALPTNDKCQEGANWYMVKDVQMLPGEEHIIDLGKVNYATVPANEVYSNKTQVCMAVAVPNGMREFMTGDNYTCLTLDYSSIEERQPDNRPQAALFRTYEGKFFCRLPNGDNSLQATDCIIVDMQGREIHLGRSRPNANGEYQFDLPVMVSNGLYACQIIVGERVFYGKLLIP